MTRRATPGAKNSSTVEERARKRATSRKKPKPKARPTDAELLCRLRIVERALIDGKRGGQILEALKLTGRDIPYTTAAGYMQRVREKWEAEDAMLRPIWRERQIRKLHDIAHTLEVDKVWGHWVSVQKLIADLEGNLAPLKIEHTQVDEFDGWELDELKRYVQTQGKEVPQGRSEDGRGVSEAGAVFSDAPGGDSAPN